MIYDFYNYYVYIESLFIWRYINFRNYCNYHKINGNPKYGDKKDILAITFSMSINPLTKFPVCEQKESQFNLKNM